MDPTEKDAKPAGKPPKTSQDKSSVGKLSVSKGEPGFCSSFKSKRYRDKLRSEIKALEALLPVDRSSLHRKLDSQTVFRLVISFFRTKVFFKAAGLPEDSPVEDALSESRLSARAKEDDDVIGHLLKEENVLQALDGFLLAAMADGTILYASESVLQYLGFNQVDLMHRCLYSVLHPEDHRDVRGVLEHTLPDSTFPRQLQKVQCSGRIQRLPGVSNSAKGSNHILFLFCRPFMRSGQDPDCDLKQNVFWTKHDMDLTFKQLDKKAADVIGYVTDDTEGDSFYGYVHPEDLTTCCVCHKALTETNDIQTMYFRLQTKGGDWIWLHSRGKVVTKNSKKYSIVFSHYPVREEDSIYIQQEIVLRQRYSMNELFYLRRNNYHLDSPAAADSIFETISQQATAQKFEHSTAQNYLEDFASPLGSCPSSWHLLSDRHSPVLPSTHVAHKISLREKQIHFQDFKKRQLQQSPRYVDGERVVQGTFGNLSCPYGGEVSSPFCGPMTQRECAYQAFRGGQEAQVSCVWLPKTFGPTSAGCFQVRSTPETSPESGVYVDHRTPNIQMSTPRVHRPPSFATLSPVADQVSVFDMPPSPPPSPHRTCADYEPCVTEDRTVRVRNVFTQHSSGGYTWVQDQTFHVRNHGHKGDARCDTGAQRGDKHCVVPTRTALHNRYRPYRSPPGSEQACHRNDQDQRVAGIKPCHTPELAVQQRTLQQKSWGFPDVHSCAVASGCCDPGEKTVVCFDPAFHMAIVDEPSGISSKADLDLPSIGSFLEYLNDI